MSKTLIEIKHALLEYFTQANIICPVEHASVIKFDCEDAGLKAALVKEGLKQLEKDEIVQKVEVAISGTPAVKEHWVLVKPLSMYQRAVICGYDTCAAVANVINAYLKAGGNDRDMVDSAQLNEGNIQSLVLITESLLPKSESKSG